MNISFLLEIDVNTPSATSAEGLFAVKPDFRLHLAGKDYEFLAWGDPISNDRFINGLSLNPNAGYIVNNLSGHFYFLLADLKRREVVIGSSLFSILPIYFYEHCGRITMSGNVFDLGKRIGLNSVSATFMLESLLFNYPLHNASLIDGITLLPSNTSLTTGIDGFNIIKHTAVEDWFTNDPEPWKRCLSRMSDVFLKEVVKYFPDEHYLTSLTGGFDGRTLVAAGLYHHRDFSCYCIGTGSSADLQIAASVAAGTGLGFTPVFTDEEYVSGRSLDAGRRFIIGSSGVATFSRAHYHYAASRLSEETRYIITGNFGSEIFRAVHNPGVMISPALYDVFISSNPDEAIEKLAGKQVMGFFNKELLNSVLPGLRKSIEELPCFDSRYINLSRNQQFYIFVFEEIFRKYFGSEIVNQASFVNNRTPFLDSVFLRELLGTGLAGIHSDFFENNPLKRFKGQALYASIIKKASPLLGRFDTAKGYRPDDLLSLTGKLRIIEARIKKGIRATVDSDDPLGVIESWRNNHSYYGSLEVDGDIFDRHAVALAVENSLTNDSTRLFSHLFSINYLKNQ